MAKNTQVTGRLLSVQKILVGGINKTPSGEIIDDDNVMLNAIRFGGDIYENEHTMADDLKYRFESTSLKLADVIIAISLKDALFGDSSNQRFPQTVGSVFGFTKVDISKLYFKNASAGQNCKVNIIATKV